MSFNLVPAYHNNWSPFRSFNSEMRMLRNMLDNEDSPTVEPSYSFESDDKGSHFEIEMPGVNKDNLSIEIKGHKLVVSGKRFKRVMLGQQKDTSEDGQKTENANGDKPAPKPSLTYLLEARLPNSADLDGIKADHLGDGILNIYVPMKTEAESRRIQIGM